MKKIKLGLVVTQESNPVNYLNAKQKLEKKGFTGFYRPIEQIDVNDFIEKAKEEKNG
jgi:hypothetical protein